MYFVYDVQRKNYNWTCSMAFHSNSFTETNGNEQSHLQLLDYVNIYLILKQLSVQIYMYVHIEYQFQIIITNLQQLDFYCLKVSFMVDSLQKSNQLMFLRKYYMYRVLSYWYKQKIFPASGILHSSFSSLSQSCYLVLYFVIYHSLSLD